MTAKNDHRKHGTTRGSLRAHQRSEGLYEGAKLWPKLLSIESDCVPREERAIGKFLQAGNLRHV